MPDRTMSSSSYPQRVDFVVHVSRDWLGREKVGLRANQRDLADMIRTLKRGEHLTIRGQLGEASHEP